MLTMNVMVRARAVQLENSAGGIVVAARSAWQDAIAVICIFYSAFI